MSVERIREIGKKLREFGDFAQGDYVYMPVSVEDEYYEMDLGQFGNQTTTVSAEDDSYQFDADELLNKFPIDSSTFLEFAEELEEYEAAPDSDLDTVLGRMENDGQGALARAIRAVVEVFESVAANSIVAAIPDMTGLSVGPLPPSPLPWPGACRPEVDYTAADFPMRYQPPPGYDWTKRGSSSRVGYRDAERIETEVLRNGSGAIYLDEKGRVSWDRGTRQLDSFESGGSRWAMWYIERNGIPEAAGFISDTWPRALDMNGVTIEYPAVKADAPEQLTDLRMWGGDVKAATGRLRARAIREAYEQQEQVVSSINEYGVNYDPLTVEVSDESDPDGIRTEDLRLGDDVTGDDFGRVLSVARDGDEYVLTMNRDGQINTERTYGNSMTWDVRPITGVNRDAQPTALSLVSWLPGDVTEYDPLTVPLVDDEVLVPSSELRLGDDILGNSFGRVVRVENDQIVMSRDGSENRTKYSDEFKWQVKKINVPNRDSLPTAASLQPAAF